MSSCRRVSAVGRWGQIRIPERKPRRISTIAPKPLAAWTRRTPRSSSSRRGSGKTRRSGAGPRRLSACGRRCAVYDSASLEEWLEQAPAVNAWIGRILGKRPPGLTTLDDYWANLQDVTNPSLKPEVFLASREKQVNRARRWLDGPPGPMHDRCEVTDRGDRFRGRLSSQDSGARDSFTCASVDRGGPRCLAGVDASSGAGLLLIADPSLAVEPELVAEAVRHGHRVLLPSGLAPREGRCIKLPGAHRYDLEKATRLIGASMRRKRGGSRRRGGRKPHRAEAASRPASGDDSARVEPSHPKPWRSCHCSWPEAGMRVSKPITPRSPALSGHPYEYHRGDRRAVADGPDAPLMRVGSRWSLVSRDDAWYLLARDVSPDALYRFGR